MELKMLWQQTYNELKEVFNKFFAEVESMLSW